MPNSKKPKFLLIGGFASSLINFRGPLLKRLVQDYEVYAAAPFIDDDTRFRVEALGVTCISNTFERTGLNPLRDIRAFKSFQQQVRQIQPDIVLAYTIKPVIFGLKAAQSTGAKRFALITGKGSAFEMTNAKSALVARVVRWLYRHTLKTVAGVIFQNTADRDFFLKNRLLQHQQNHTVIKGTGVDMNHYTLQHSASIPKKVTFLFIARLIKEKGIPELVAATKALQKQHSNFEVQLLGWVDMNPGGISQQEIEALHESGVVNYLGTTNDIRPYMESADVFVLPSYYNEGLPRTIQEAMAMQKAIITTDHPGCRDTVEDGRNGKLIPIKDSRALGEAMAYFIKNPKECLRMGKESYGMAKEKFDVHYINQLLLKFIEESHV